MAQDENTRTRSESFSLDSLLVRIGQFGRVQIFNYILMCIPLFINAVLTVSYVFVASTVAHRCQVPNCDNQNSTYQESWVEFTIPKKLNGDLENCRRYVPLAHNNSISDNVCLAEGFSKGVLEECGSDLIFRDNEVTISTDFNLYCSDEWKLALVGTISSIGQFIGIPLGGYLSDRYGRRNVLAICGFISAIMGVLQSLSTDYYTFMVLALLTNVFGSSLYAIVFVLGLELVSPKVRVVCCTIMTTIYVLGQSIFALVAKYFQNWRYLQLFFFIPALFQIFFLCLLPESVRWLLSQGEEEKATKIIVDIAKSNNRKLSKPTIDKFLLSYRYKYAEADEGKFPIKQTFRSLFWRIANCSLCWFTNVLVYYGLNMNLVLLGGNKFNNFMLVTLIEIPGTLLPFWTMNRFGRRISIFGYMVFGGICIGATLFIGKDQFYFNLILLLLGKFSISSSFQVLYFFTSEVFPTNVRNSLLSFCSMFGRFGSMVAPQTPVIAKLYEPAPVILFAGFSFLSGCLTLFFPETNNEVLPSTLKEAEKIGQKKSTEDVESTLLKPVVS